MKTNKRIMLLPLIAALALALLMSACSLKTAEKGVEELPALPTKVPALVEEVVNEVQQAVTEVPQGPLDIEQVPFMYYQEAEEFLAPYAGYIEGMLWTRAVDLAVTEIQDGTSTAERGHQFEGLITVRNNGFAASPQVKLTCEVHGTYGLGGWQWVAPLAAGEERTVRIGFTGLEPGAYDYTCVVDSDNTLIELNKFNNSKTITIRVGMTDTDLRIVSIQEISSTAIIGYDHEFKVTVENVGPERSYKVLMRCSYPGTFGSPEEQVVWVGQMANAGDTVEIICGFNGVPSGTHILTVEVDWGNMIDEKNETNNIDTYKFSE